jgi:TonB-linked SusC/RagA family outer membrane protein
MKRFTFCFSLIIAAFALFAASVSAQELVIAGTVVSKGTGDALPGANIVVKGTQLGTTTDASGKFRLTLSGMSRATLAVSFIGYKTVEIAVTSSTQELGVALEEDILKLSGVVVTGLATSVAKRNIANSVATVTAQELVPAPAQTLDGALSGKFPGITVSQNSGAPGGGIDVKLRGVSTINGANQPLYVVDGVIVNNSEIQSGVNAVTLAAAAGSRFPQDQPVNRIADVNPSDIETLEVLKGASAAAVYGSKAANGVIIINTKKGTAGKTKVDVKQQIGFTSLLNKIGTRRFANVAAARAQYGADGEREFLRSGGKFIDYEEEVYGQKGLLNETTVSAQGGSERTQFFISGLYKNDEGIVKNTGYEKYSGRLNLNHRLSEKIDVNLNTNFLRSASDRGLFGNDNSGATIGISLAFTPSFFDGRPVNGVYPVNPFVSANPLQTIDLIENNELVYRTISSGQLNWNIFRSRSQTLDFIVQGGIDFFSQENQAYFPRELQFEINSSLPGTSIRGTTESKNTNLYWNLVHNYTTSGNISFRTSAGAQFENQDRTNVLVVADGLPPDQKSVDQGSSITVTQNIVLQRERGFFAQEEVNLDDKIFLTAGVRGDASSTNGDTKKYFLFPKASASLRLSQYGFWQGLSSTVNEFKLRAAYGQTGNLPVPTAKFTSFGPANTGGRGGLLLGAVRGNPAIEPERVKELEMGFDATLFNGYGILEVSYFRKDISNLLLFRELPPSTGYASEAINGGKMKSNGIEVSLGATPFHRNNFTWTSRVNFYTTDAEVTELDVPAFNVLGFADVLGRYRIEVGKSPTQIVGREQGRLLALGEETPDFQMSFNNQFRLGNFELGFLWDRKKGGDVINLTKLLTDLGGTSGDYDTGAAAERLRNFGTKTSIFIEDGSYWKLREADLSYSFNRQTVANWFGGQVSYLKVGVSGRNLIMITDYTSYDPEVSNFGNQAIGRSIEVNPFPSSRSFYFNLAFGF